jgi:hypothetical protein
MSEKISMTSKRRIDLRILLSTLSAEACSEARLFGDDERAALCCWDGAAACPVAVQGRGDSPLGKSGSIQ